MASSLNGRGDSNAKDANEDGNPFDASIVKVAEKVDELRGNVKAERKKEMSKQLLTKEEMETYTGVIRWLHVHIYGSRYFSLTVLWLSWLVVGTVFYSQYMTGFGLKRGFYMAVNTGECLCVCVSISERLCL